MPLPSTPLYLPSSPSTLAKAGGLEVARRCPLLSFLSLLLTVGPAQGWNDLDRILLWDAKALTLH